MKMKRKKNTQKKHSKRNVSIGLFVRFTVYSNRRNLREQDLDWLTDKFIDLVESRKWYAGGGVRLVDLDKDTEE